MNEGKMETLLRQKNGGVGNYRRYLIKLYNYIANKVQENHSDYCTTDIKEMISAVYEGNPDHMAYQMVVTYKKDLSKLGYIRNEKIGNEWRTYIIKEIDF